MSVSCRNAQLLFIGTACREVSRGFSDNLAAVSGTIQKGLEGGGLEVSMEREVRAAQVMEKLPPPSLRFHENNFLAEY